MIFSQTIVGTHYTDVVLKAKTRVKPIPRNRGAVKRARFAMRKVLADFLATMAIDIGKQLSTLMKADTNEIKRILNQLNMTDFVDLSGDLGDILEALAMDSSSEALLQLGVDTVDGADMFSFVNENASTWGKQRGAEMVGMKWVGDNLIENPNAKWRIDESTREMLRGAVGEAIDGGWSTNRLADYITNSYAFSSDRAEMIARTETAMADIQGNMIAYRDSGLVGGKQWVTAGDDLVSEDCAANGDAGVVDLDAAFPSGAMEPPDHPNCRCDLLPVLKDELETESALNEHEAADLIDDSGAADIMQEIVPDYTDDNGNLRSGRLDAYERKVEALFYNDIKNHKNELMQRYHDEFGLLIDPDKVKELSIDFAHNKALAAAVHEPSSMLSKDILNQYLMDKKLSGDKSPTIFTAGGSGSGKSVTLDKVIEQGLAQKGGLTIDSVLSNFNSAKSRIDATLAATEGAVRIVYTNATLENALIQNAKRARAVNIDTLVSAHVGASNNIRVLSEAYKDNSRVDVVVMNNLGTLKDVGVGKLTDVPVYDKAVMRSQLIGVADKLLRDGVITKERYNLLIK